MVKYSVADNSFFNFVIVSNQLFEQVFEIHDQVNKKLAT